MGVYLPNMEMPKEYGPHEITITFFVRDDGTASLWGKEVFIPHEPLEVIPIPPHGRLGDLEKLEQMFVDIDNAPYSGFDGSEPFYSAEDAAQIIRLAPTIIPASEEEMK